MGRVRILKGLFLKKSILVAGSMCFITLVTICLLAIGGKAENSTATVITHGFATNNVVPGEVGEKGTETNPLVVVEVVPDMKFAQIGYLFRGCEPVDIDRILQDVRNGDSAANQFMNDIEQSGAANYDYSVITFRKFDYDSKTDVGTWDRVTWEKMTQTGYYERVADGKGLLIQKVDTNGNVTYVRQSGGNFIWVPDTRTNPPATNHNAPNIGDRVYTTRTDDYWINYNYKVVSYTHNNTFLKYSANVPDDKLDDYHVVVKTVTPSELNNNSGWADRADLVVFTNKSYRSTLCTGYKKYSKVPYTNNSTSDTELNFSNSNDLNWSTVMKLFHKIAIDEDQSGAIIDQNVFGVMLNNGKNEGSVKSVNAKQIDSNGAIIASSDNSCEGSNNNVFKLCLMLNTMNPQALYNLFLYDYPDGGRKAAITEKTINGRTTGSFDVQEGDAKTYWGVNTFMPAKRNGTASVFSDWKSGECYTSYETKTQLQYGYSTVNSHVYLFQGDMSIMDNFAQPDKIKPNDLNKELFDYLEKEMGTRQTQASPAQTVRFVMGLRTDLFRIKESIKVLDLEPCTISSTLTSKKAYLTEFDIRTKLVPTYTGRIELIHQSSSEFNGNIKDLNSTYDLIYMGLYYGRFNTVSGDTVYNDKKLNGKVYLHTGDMVTSRNVNQHTVNWPTNMNNISRGPGNDITTLKKDALAEYLQANLPIITDVDLYNLNSFYLDPYSNIHSFILDNKSKANLLNAADTAIGTKAISYFKKTGLVLHMNEEDYPKEYDGDTTTGTIGSGAYISRNLTYKFTLEDSEYKSGMTCTAKLYIDTNRDGFFSIDELIDQMTGLKANGTKYVFNKTLGSDFVGAIPWKLVVSKDSNTAIRDSKEGISAIKRATSEKKTIHILQVTDKTGSTLNLQQNVQKKGLFYKYTSNLNDYIVRFTTIDTQTFESWYTASNRFDKSASLEAKAMTDKLKDYNMVILGFADYYSNISNQYGALDNIKYFIDMGKSVLFTHDTTSFFNVADESTKNLASIKAYNFNVQFRDYLGMDRFGIRTTDPALKATKDRAIAPDGSIYKEIHGYTYQALAKLGDGTKTQYPLYTGSKISTNTNLTTKATKINSGQITEYPYKIPENLKVAPTHSQYFQLDLKDEDMVVWYTLEQSDGDGNGYFSCSERDAANNYYIYSKGNITYSGVGHSDMSNNEMEVKLFINTMIAAYGNGNEPPTVEVVNPGAYSPSKNEYSLYVSVDYAETMFDETRNEDVFFIPHNNSLVTDTLYVKVKTADGSLMKIYDEEGNLITTDSSGYARLSDGDMYQLKWPQSYLSQPNKKDISFECYYVDAKDKTHTGIAFAHLLRRNLFDLE